MRSKVYSSERPKRKASGILAITGQNVKLRVRRHQLLVEDGFPLEGPQRGRIVSRATDRLERVLITAGSGFATLSAWDWFGENEIAVAATSQSGGLRWMLLPGKGGEYQARLKRSAALAPFTGIGLEIAQWLVTRKIEGQRDVLHELAAKIAATLPAGVAVPGAILALEKSLARVGQARTITALRAIEAKVADVYWSAFAGLPLHYAPPSYARTIPDCWRRFVGRGSPLNQGNRNAVDPVGCLLNYSYALLEVEAVLAIHRAGLDPYLDVCGLHTDIDHRRSCCYSIMEPIRPVADRFVLNFVMSHAFRPGELHLLRDGRTRLDQTLCARLWPWMPEFRRALGPVMTFVLGRLRRGPRLSEQRVYRLTEVPAETQRRRALGQQRWAKNAAPPRLRPAGVCRSCGTLLEETPDRDYCDACLPARHGEVVAAFAAKGPSVLAKLRQEGRDPTKTPEARRKQGATMARRHAEARAWERTHPGAHDPEVFRRTILPGLASVPLRTMIKATGLSLRSCARIRQGMVVPHARHWEALRRVAIRKV